ncbi:hypothetical protein A1O3_04012 [Capronia epimyces CBS 606.96]|uniref:BAH domain-containing protein n=1 Tax=Capronia epimyces CBS 606.96 TaxID=1182542 RepID=W9YBL9_9EURO|nr:uncharacterized protein A1O3_04012 [Capronia epimyces CBS 606.96]EXJ87055.1 hypothetical protein A1O3_04012 [Capronia epimyces CBS 606.96]
MPLTPGDSDTEVPSGLSQKAGRRRIASEMAGRKRTASEMEDDASTSRSADTGSDTDTDLDQSSESSGAGTRAASGADGADGSETIEADVDDEFDVQCPPRPRRGKQAAADDVFEGTDAPSLAPQLEVDYAIRPGSKWKSLGVFRNAKFKNPTVVIYTVGQIVYINRHNPVPPPPPVDASEEERLEYDKANFWVGLIAEIRAENHAKVYARVFWFYWPEELPMGRQPYHGRQELILSNCVDVVETHSIASHAEVSHWDENDDSNQNFLLERYWRQTLDVKIRGHNALSKLRTYCICGGYDTPQVEMYQCHTVGCGMWNHEACLVKDLERRAWKQFKQGRLTHEVPEKMQDKRFTQKVGETLGHIVNLGLGRAEAKDEADSEVTPAAKGTKKLKGKKNPWAGKLKGKIVKVGEDIHQAYVTQLVPTASSKLAWQSEPNVWRMKMSCLKCRQLLD